MALDFLSSSKSQVQAAPEGFTAFREFLEGACGILLGENKAYLVNSRLSDIMKENDCSGLEQLVQKMRLPSGKRLKELVIDAMTTNETLWFRDIHPYEILENRILPELAKSLDGKPLRIWSAACSSGQEPYSISMVIDNYKRMRPGMLRGTESITATDISPSMLAHAKAGKYDMLALGRGLPKERLEKYFLQSPQGGYEVKPDIKRRVDFRLLNLQGSFQLLGKFDVVFCRNVLIYFSSELKEEILRKIHGTLKPGGYLFLGASESLGNVSDIYEMVHCNPGIIYRVRDK